MSGVVIPDPRGGHVWVYGIDADGNPVRLLVDAGGKLQIEVTETALPTDAATETTLALIRADTDDIPKHANLDIHPVTKHLGVAVDESVLPDDAATETTVAAILAAMINRAATPVIYNVTMTLAATEYSQALPSNTKKFLIKCRTAYNIKVCFTSGQSGTTYLTVPAGMSYYEDLIQPTSLTLYFQCATAAQVAEIVAWS